MKDSYLTAGMKLDRLFQLLHRNKPALTPKTIFRILFLFQSACWSSLFAIIEKKKYSKKIWETPLPDNPIFIIGHWRTGSTLLHQLMNLDPNLKAPTLFQVAVPDSFLVSYPYYKPIFRLFMDKHRPMDRVKLGPNEPQEDEYAIFRITGISPLEALIFPKSKTYFLLDSHNHIPNKDHLPEWQNQIRYFYKKLSFHGGKRIVSKNPFNSFRIPLLYTLFPQARFIHIHRHPYDVIPSTIHMWEIIQQQNCLNTKAHRPSVDEILAIFDQTLTTINRDLQTLPSGTSAEVRFDALEQNPVNALKSLYNELKLPFTDEFEKNIVAFSNNNQVYKKNTFSLSSSEKKVIAQRMQVHMKRFGYC